MLLYTAQLLIKILQLSIWKYTFIGSDVTNITNFDVEFSMLSSFLYFMTLYNANKV